MKRNTIYIILSAVAMLGMLLSACGAAATPTGTGTRHSAPCPHAAPLHPPLRHPLHGCPPQADLCIGTQEPGQPLL